MPNPFPVDNNLDHLDPSFKEKVELFLADAKSQGFNISVFEGLRTQARQDYLYSIGRTIQKDSKPVTWTTTSNHEDGKAVDIVFMVNGLPSWQGDYMALRAIASKYQIGNLGSKEYCHFEDNGIPLHTTTKYTGVLQDLIKQGYKPVFTDFSGDDQVIKELIEI